MTKLHYEKLRHGVPPWVKAGAIYHIRVRTEAPTPTPLSNPMLAAELPDSARFYESEDRWHILLFLLMPDHLHALLAPNPSKPLSSLVGDWKKYHARANHILWQDNFFDHRIRNDVELWEKAAYIRRNPVAKGLCAKEDEWPWWISETTTAALRTARPT